MNRAKLVFGIVLLGAGILLSVASGDAIYIGLLIPGVGYLVRGLVGQPVVKGKPAREKIARGMGPAWVRIVLVVLAGLYFGVLLKHPKFRRMNDGDSRAHNVINAMIDVVAHLSSCTGLFPESAKLGVGDHKWVPGGREYRFEAWSCQRNRWEPLDTRPYFPIQADDKESRLPRILQFYFGDDADDGAMMRSTMFALDDYLYAHHDGDVDNVPGPIGGIRMWSIKREYGEPGDPVERYHNDPLAPIPTERAEIKYNTPRGTRKDHKPGIKKRCGVTDAVPETPEPDVAAPVRDPWGGS